MTSTDALAHGDAAVMADDAATNDAATNDAVRNDAARDDGASASPAGRGTSGRSAARLRPFAPRPDTAFPDFRQRATVGVALIALLLLLPFAVLSLARGQWALTSGAHGILLLLGASALAVRRGRRHQEIVLYALVPAGMLFMTRVIDSEPFAGIVWCYPSILACYCMLDQRRAWAANVLILLCAVPSAWLSLELMLAARITATLFAVSAFAAILVRVIDAQQTRLHEQVMTDALTGLLNRLPLADALEAAVEAHRRRASPAALLALDLDHFKRVNDEHGHDAGDDVLRTVGRLLQLDADADRRAFRVGGEEFLVLLTGELARDAAAAADELCESFRTHPGLARHGVTVSMGLAALGPDEDRRAWTRRADALLYAAKRGGRDRVAA